MPRTELRLTLMFETRCGIYGLDADGVGWVYQGHKHGWSRLNMTAMTEAEYERKRAPRDHSEAEYRDDIPF